MGSIRTEVKIGDIWRDGMTGENIFILTAVDAQKMGGYLKSKHNRFSFVKNSGKRKNF